MPRILILGGTGEARALADALVAATGVEVVSSLAGRVRNPTVPAGQVRTGGFGGVEGLTQWIRAQSIDAIVDATHPFAATITSNASMAAWRCGVPLVVLRRPDWQPAGDARWHSVADNESAASLLPTVGSRAFLTIGRQEIAAFAAVAGVWFLVRSIDPPDTDLPARSELILSRGPFTVSDETELMRRHRIDVLVTKNSGGDQTAAKLEAAACLGIPVVVVERPQLPVGVATVESVDGAVAWVMSLR